jgi:hypothetical protein
MCRGRELGREGAREKRSQGEGEHGRRGSKSPAASVG